MLYIQRRTEASEAYWWANFQHEHNLCNQNLYQETDHSQHSKAQFTSSHLLPTSKVTIIMTSNTKHWFCQLLNIGYMDSSCMDSFVPGLFCSLLYLWDSAMLLLAAVVRSFSSLCGTPLYQRTMVSLRVLLVMDIWTASSVGLLCIALLWTFLHKYWCVLKKMCLPCLLSSLECGLLQDVFCWGL